LSSAARRAIVRSLERNTMVNSCGICGNLIRTEVPPNWHPAKQQRRAQRDMAAHLKTHSFAEVLRFEIRQDLDQVPEEQRGSIVRDVYRALLGKMVEGQFVLGDADAMGVYSIDEVLGAMAMYRLWRTAASCGMPGCVQHG
jgi:hypothetical protein